MNKKTLTRTDVINLLAQATKSSTHAIEILRKITEQCTTEEQFVFILTEATKIVSATNEVLEDLKAKGEIK